MLTIISMARRVMLLPFGVAALLSLSCLVIVRFRVLGTIGVSILVVELSRQMSSCKDLVVEPSQLGSLKGLKRDKGHGSLYWFGPLR